MKIVKKYVVLDAADLETEARFWAETLGGTAENIENPDPTRWRDVVVDGRVELAIQAAPDHVAPIWPPREPADQRQQAHYDLFVDPDELEAAEAEMLGLGASLLQSAPVVPGKHGFRVYADPAGHPFCLCWG